MEVDFFGRNRTVLGAKAIEELSARISEAVASSPVRDVEKNVRALLASGLARLDVVTREEFDRQEALLRHTRERLEALAARIAEIEARQR
jgi:BMFP domain-containing protein YqiC